MSNRSNNRPTVQPQPQRVSPQEAQARPELERVRRQPQPQQPAKRRWPLVVGIIIIAVALILALGYIFSRNNSIASEIDTNKFQFVKLQNTLDGPEYFGKLSVVNNDYYRLTNVFYLKRKTDTAADAKQSVEQVDASDFELIKLGNELHGPEDEIIISRDQILFFENLKNEGTVSKTIKTYLEENK